MMRAMSNKYHRRAVDCHFSKTEKKESYCFLNDSRNDGNSTFLKKVHTNNDNNDAINVKNKIFIYILIFTVKCHEKHHS